MATTTRQKPRPVQLCSAERTWGRAGKVALAATSTRLEARAPVRPAGTATASGSGCDARPTPPTSSAPTITISNSMERVVASRGIASLCGHSFPHSPSLWFARSQEQRPRIQTRATQRPVFERLGEPTAAQMLDQFKPSASSRPSRSTSPLPRLAGQPVAVQPDEADQLVERGGLCDNPHSPGGLGARCAGSGAIGRAQGGNGYSARSLFAVGVRRESALALCFVGNHADLSCTR